MANPVKVTFKGVPEFNQKLGKAQKDLEKKLFSGLFLLGNAIITLAKQKYVPVDQGILKSSGFTEQPVFKSRVYSVTMGFGGAAGAYALKQHEDLTLNHTVGGAKYLEIPLLEVGAKAAARLAAELRL